ncbi:hypothetical protein BRE01_19950 [Brevibacillus reuszeri]|uniref:Uncharacterized protein n=1 Tax=Brevibacillus reuszeri TaxID=54915 RepID=A0A0K9YX72_9BACL|nr:hypothetical protein [Brevibacillus reuszeri]KNB73334.1 hypothetical protein ADS79_05070 [Brevibacillus reuszeri]MED1856955.1 hypothetical protein [Brevibacillus reuszeri]GED68293.1 hypothetical protein BRE01_19950 [Brevibacillus reuszeri]
MKAARIYLSVLCLSLGFLFGFSPAEKKSKATWIWQSEIIGQDKQQVLEFCEQNEINLIYLRIDMNKPSDYYRSFIREATAQGIEVHAVAGHPAWAFESNQKRMMNIVAWVKKYNLESEKDERIRGIQLDIEPYLLPQWETERERVIREWQANVEVFTEAVRDETGLTSSVALAFWLDDIPTPDDPDMPLSKWMIDQFDTICIMAYRDKLEGSNGILALIEQEMHQADELGKRVLVAVNMKKDVNDHVSFAEEGVVEMNRVLSLLPEHLEQHPSYNGVAIHDYRYWREAAASMPDVPSDRYMGTYIWRAETIRSEKDEILSFAKENDVNLLYVRIDMEQPITMYREFVKEAKAAGIEVHAMGGHPIWALTESRGKILKLVNWVKAYNQQVSPSEQFRGVHLDIEPYVMPVWREDKEAVLRQWMGNIEVFVEATKDGTNLETSVDLAAWLDKTPTPGQEDKPFSHWMIEQLDHTTLMAFRDHAAGIIGLVENQMKFAQTINKKLVVAVETKESHEGDFVTFFEEGRSEMNRQLRLVEQALERYSSYTGQAIHAYEYWKDSKE